jgi:hypothetical protein
MPHERRLEELGHMRRLGMAALVFPPLSWSCHGFVPGQQVAQISTGPARWGDLADLGALRIPRILAIMPAVEGSVLVCADHRDHGDFRLP